ncbi:FAD-dependent monooxygenase [Hoeflea poritis]|uniref:FAD-dependent monooxygenase n=1 Tax=Hoeflea poritis TaxID=2993659 RepID=A0ABT4VVB5_9HYPH|nr:FAD-dependent monooxygenase [Hoeflea poritis]MDA4848574.1 FAD-dependent monooxygenase [Hoeflea poritis]
MSQQDADIPVLVVGAGSVGLSLAAELGYRGLDAMLIERAAGLNPHPRANAVANRTMEYYRRWGLDEAIASTGLPPDLPSRYLWVSSLFGQKVHEVDLPSPTNIRESARGGYAAGEHSWSPYLKTITGQNNVEEIILGYVKSRDSLSVHFQTELVSFRDMGDHVRCTLRDLATRQDRDITCRYLAACDGGRSPVREHFQVPLHGRAALSRFISIYFRAPDLIEKNRFGNANIYFPLHKEYRGFLLNWDGVETFTYHLILKSGQHWEDVDPASVIRALAGRDDMPVDVISTQPWTAHALTAEEYRPSPNIFLVGDAAHLFTPTGGFGMNTGVSDAIDLAWKLQAALEGWAGNGLLDSYSEERQPIGVRNTSEAAHCFDGLYSVMQNGDELDGKGAEGAELRDALRENIKQQEKLIVSSGTLLGYRYEGSSIIASDGTPAPADHPRNYQPTARPGHRAPHVWLQDGSALMDHFGTGFTLVVATGAEADTSKIERAAQDAGMPLTVYHQPEPAVRDAYEADFTLVRPDLMVAWRGDTLPQDPDSVLNVVTGSKT